MMRYLSPTSLKLFYSDRDKFYLYYLSPKRAMRDPQTPPMAVGSAFDAYVKSYLVERLLGKVDPAFELDTILNQQVEPQNRDEARTVGKHLFELYKNYGALSDILVDLEGAIGKPRFETSLEGYVTGVGSTIGDVPFLGKPDIFFISKKGARVIFDWKVNGYYSARGMSPSPGYIRIRTGESDNGACHPKCIPTYHNGVKIAMNYPLCGVDKDWAAQLSIYAWLLGEPIGSQFIVAIDQLACGLNRNIRIAQHRAIVTAAFQQKVYESAHHAWYLIQSGHVFDKMTREESDRRCAMLTEITANPPDSDLMDLCR